MNLYLTLDSILASIGKPFGEQTIHTIAMTGAYLEIVKTRDLITVGYVRHIDDKRVPLFYQVKGQAQQLCRRDEKAGPWIEEIRKEHDALEWELDDDIEEMIERYGIAA